MWAVGISQIIEYIMDGKDYQRGSVEKDGNKQRNSEVIQYEEIAISRTSYKALAGLLYPASPGIVSCICSRQI